MQFASQVTYHQTEENVQIVELILKLIYRFGQWKFLHAKVAIPYPMKIKHVISKIKEEVKKKQFVEFFVITTLQNWRKWRDVIVISQRGHVNGHFERRIAVIQKNCIKGFENYLFLFIFRIKL